MNTKFLLIAGLTLTLASCSTAYKSGQTPDDVYYSPVAKYEDKDDEEDKKEEERRNEQARIQREAEERRDRQAIRDRRWREDEWDFQNNPYDYCYGNNTRFNRSYAYSYYYNPKFYAVPVYNPTPSQAPVRQANLQTYKGYTQVVTTYDPNTKTSTTTTAKPKRQYNNNNFLNRVVEAVTGTTNTKSSTTTSSSSSTGREYKPSGGSTGTGTTVTRPGRGG